MNETLILLTRQSLPPLITTMFRAPLFAPSLKLSLDQLTRVLRVLPCSTLPLKLARLSLLQLLLCRLSLSFAPTFTISRRTLQLDARTKTTAEILTSFGQQRNPSGSSKSLLLALEVRVLAAKLDFELRLTGVPTFGHKAELHSL